MYVCMKPSVHNVFFLFSFTPLTCIAVQALATPITAATIELYQRIVRDLPPTPSKFHYIFNLRDLSRIYHGLFTTIPERYEEMGSFVRVWRNECLRVFYDRLTNDKDRSLVSEHISELLQQFFQDQAEVCCTIHVNTRKYSVCINVHKTNTKLLNLNGQYTLCTYIHVHTYSDIYNVHICLYAFRGRCGTLCCMETIALPSSQSSPGYMKIFRTMRQQKDSLMRYTYMYIHTYIVMQD